MTAKTLEMIMMTTQDTFSRPPMTTLDHIGNKGGGGARRPRSVSNGSEYASQSSSDESSLIMMKSPTRAMTTTTKSKNKKNKYSKKQKKNVNKSNATQQQQAAATTLSLEEQALYVAMDCEMVGVGNGGFKSALARVTLVNWNGLVLLDEFIKPDREVTDYRTFVSGITAADLECASDLAAVRDQVLEVIRDKVLVGHGLKNDLSALDILHPWQMTRDTAKYEPFMKVRFEDGVLWPRKLKDLCNEKIKRSIQVAGQPHCPVEDAIAALDLYKSVRCKWEKVMQYKIAKTQEIETQRVSILASQ